MTMSLLLTPRVIRDIAAVEHFDHSRFRVYPQVVTDSVQLEAGTPANTFGDWVQIVPIDTVPFLFDVIGIVVEVVNAETTYHIQLGYSLTAASPEANYESGERRFRIATLPIARGTELLDFRGQDTPAYSSIWGRLKTASGAADTADISIVLSRHVETSSPIPKWPAFPW